MAKNLDIAERIIRAEYERLCNVAGLVPVPLDVYVCDAEAPPTEKTALGFPIANSDPCYSGSVRLMALPLCEGNEWPTTIPGFPPRGLDKHSDEWPVWRIEIWHEVVHQVTNDICCKWNPKETGRRRPNETMSTSGHGPDWFAGVTHLAGKLGVDPEALDALLDQ